MTKLYASYLEDIVVRCAGSQYPRKVTGGVEQETPVNNPLLETSISGALRTQDFLKYKSLIRDPTSV